jgi:transcriptional regulator with XRE-family HTH domain
VTAESTPHPVDSNTLQVLLGQCLREVRQGSGLTQGELAQALSARLGEPISRSTIGNYETGRRPLPADLLLQIAAICDVPLQTFALIGASEGYSSTPATEQAQHDLPSQVAAPKPNSTSDQALTLINQSLQARPDIIPYVLELIAGLVEEPSQK